MVMVNMNRGFTMLDTLVSLFIVSLMLLVGLPKMNVVNTEHYSFMNDYLLRQSEAFTRKEKTYLDGYPIYFNRNGHVNLGNTFEFKNHKVIVMLGNGYARIE